MSEGEFREACDRLYEARDAFLRAEEKLLLVVARMHEPGFDAADFVEAMSEFVDLRVDYIKAEREQDDASNRRNED